MSGQITEDPILIFPDTFADVVNYWQVPETAYVVLHVL